MIILRIIHIVGCKSDKNAVFACNFEHGGDTYVYVFCRNRAFAALLSIARIAA